MMSKTQLSLSTQHADRLEKYVASSSFTCVSSVAKSAYWQHYSKLLGATRSGGERNRVTVSGEIGFYVPPSKSPARRFVEKAVRAAREPALVGRAVKDRVRARLGVPRFMSQYEAFNAVMRHDPISDPDLSPWRVNHLELAKKPHVFATAEAITEHYESWSGHSASPSIIEHYYAYNLIRGFVSNDEIRTVLDIGPGSGNFPSLFYKDWAPTRLILVDLPETLLLSFSFLASLFPEATFILPNEAQSGLPATFDFALLTVDQLDLVNDSSIDLAINTDSFQEMKQEQIALYFSFIQRVCRDDGYFFTTNRIEKLPVGPDSYTTVQTERPNRFAEYPWDTRNQVLINEVSRLNRLLRLDAHGVRLERVRKS